MPMAATKAEPVIPKAQICAYTTLPLQPQSPRTTAITGPTLKSSLLRFSTRVAVVLGVAVAVAVAVTTWKGLQSQAAGAPSSSGRARGRVADDIEVVDGGRFPGRCGAVQQNIDYDPGNAFQDVMDHIPNFEMCCAMCHGTPECQGWTWKNLSLPGEPHRCILLHEPPMNPVGAPGAVSGVPPPRPSPPARPPAPAQQPPGAAAVPGSLYCWVLIVADTYEGQLVWEARQMGRGIFACEEWSIYSNRQFYIDDGVEISVVDSDLHAEVHEIAWNTWIFIVVWRKVLEEGKWQKTPWTVKVDADSVFMPDRLRIVLQDHSTASWMQNCGYGLHGPIEVFSQGALQEFANDYRASPGGDRPQRCMERFPESIQGDAQWGEDMFMDACFTKVYGFTSEYDVRMMCEDHCDCPDWFWCTNGSQRVVYHPFKRPELWKQCLANAMDGLPM